jgi:hypothetical protein
VMSGCHRRGVGPEQIMQRIHIVGSGPRTGTTLLAECIAACFHIDAHAQHETPIRRHRKGMGIYLTKKPADLLIVGSRLKIDRHLHVIAMLRDPRDMAVSRHSRAPERYYAPLRFWKRRVPILRQLQRHPRFIVVRYESLVREPDAIQERLRRKMPFLIKKAPFSEFHQIGSPSAKSIKATGSLRPISESSIGRWRDHLPRLAGQLLLHGPISDELIEFGYEWDENWLELLEGVEPDLTPSHFPEHSRLRKFQIWRLKYGEAARIAAARLLGIPVV